MSFQFDVFRSSSNWRTRSDSTSSPYFQKGCYILALQPSKYNSLNCPATWLCTNPALKIMERQGSETVSCRFEQHGGTSGSLFPGGERNTKYEIWT